jgi:hypothetical protein
MTKEQIAAIRALADTVVEAVGEAGELGAPGGVIYAALMQYGCNLSQYESLMSALCRAGRLRRGGDLYYLA